MSEPITFGISIPEIFKRGFVGWRHNIIPLTLGGLLTLGVSTGVSVWAQEIDETLGFRWLITNLIGYVIGGTLAYPWFAYALQAADGEKVDLMAPFAHPGRFGHMFVATFWFWAGVMLGIRFFVIPSLLVLMFYAFYGYIVAEGTKGGSHALGTSVRLGDKRRIGLFGIATLFMIFNLFGVMFGLAVEQPVLRIVIATLGLAITSSITLVAGAAIYRVLQGFLAVEDAKLIAAQEKRDAERQTNQQRKKRKRRGR